MSTDPQLILHQLVSPAFPTGAFAWSHGLETAVQEGRVRDVHALEAWLRDVLAAGAGWSDAVLAWHAARGEDLPALNEFALALAPSKERRAETREQGAAFAACVRGVWGVAVTDMAYPVAFGATLAALDLPRGPGIAMMLSGMVANLAAAGVRLVPLGQTDGQRVAMALHPLCQDLSDRAESASLDEIGGFAPMLDVASMRHETLYSRLFRS